MNRAEEVLNLFEASLQDDALGGFSMQSLADTVNANEPNRDAKAVMKVFKEMAKEAMSNAEASVKANMKAIVKAAQ